MPRDAPVARAPFHDRLCTVTLAPDCDHVPDQPWSMTWLPGNGKVNVQVVMGSPVLVMVRLPPNPLPLSHALVYVTWQAGAAWAIVAGSVAPSTLAVSSAAAANAVRRRLS